MSYSTIFENFSLIRCKKFKKSYFATNVSSIYNGYKYELLYNFRKFRAHEQHIRILSYPHSNWSRNKN